MPFWSGTTIVKSTGKMRQNGSSLFGVDKYPDSVV
jgi:hypothetical protein